MLRQDYFLGFFFVLDCVATSSLILDLTWVADLLQEHPRARPDIQPACGCERRSCDTDARVRTAPLIFRELGTSVRAGPGACTTHRRLPVRAGARAGGGDDGAAGVR